jgi:uncharacterized protein (UPF0332 family)
MRSRQRERDRAATPESRRSFEAAEEILSKGHTDFAVSRAYYGCFYVAQALLLSRGLVFARHGQVIAQFGLHFAKTRLLDTRFHALLSEAFGLRQGADYEADAVIEDQEVVEVVRQGREFLAAAAEFLENSVDRGAETPSPS